MRAICVIPLIYLDFGITGTKL